MANLVKHSFSLAGHRTSVALEAEFWAALTAIAGPRPLSALVAELDAAPRPRRKLASTLRLHALRHAHEATKQQAEKQAEKQGSGAF